MKKQIIKLIHSLGGRARYSGRDRTLYIDDPYQNGQIKLSILQEIGFSNLPFQLVQNEKPPVRRWKMKKPKIIQS